MAGGVEFKDFSMEVLAELDETTIAWLYEEAAEIEAEAKRTCKTDYEEGGKQLKGSYAFQVDESKGVAQVGSPMEAAYWEEWGTGEYAAHGDGRKGYWIYTPGSPGPSGKPSNVYNTREEAEEMAAYIRKKYGKAAVVTNGQPPNYTLERAFESRKGRAEKHLADMLKERME